MVHDGKGVMGVGGRDDALGQVEFGAPVGTPHGCLVVN